MELSLEKGFVSFNSVICAFSFNSCTLVDLSLRRQGVTAVLLGINASDQFSVIYFPLGFPGHGE